MDEFVDSLRKLLRPKGLARLPRLACPLLYTGAEFESHLTPQRKWRGNPLVILPVHPGASRKIRPPAFQLGIRESGFGIRAYRFSLRPPAHIVLILLTHHGGEE